MTDFLVFSVLVGVVATALLDVQAVIRTRLLGTPSADYALVGRWIAHMRHGRFHHASMSSVPRARGERGIDWIAHYLIGIAFAAVLLGAWGLEWVRAPTPGPALIVGIGSVAAPFLLMQPGMGAGLAARRTPNPSAARVRSLVTHAIFGLGLYAGGWTAALLVR